MCRYCAFMSPGAGSPVSATLRALPAELIRSGPREVSLCGVSRSSSISGLFSVSAATVTGSQDGDERGNFVAGMPVLEGVTELTLSCELTAELIESCAGDHMVVRAARVSTQGQHNSFPHGANNTGLINFLMKNRHGTPFEHNSFTFRVHAPIFVMREFQRHRIGWSYNEESGRYREMEPVFYVPFGDRNLVQTGKAGAYQFEPGTDEQVLLTARELARNSAECYERYQDLLQQGIAREVARMALPVNLYSSMYATCNARSLMAFLSLRTHKETAAYPSFPMREIEIVAEAMEVSFRDAMPMTWNAFVQHGRVAP
jgi:thymidylate synthase (FAD)